MKKYWPLVVIILISALGGVSLLPLSKGVTSDHFMINMSGFFFLFLSTLKFWDLTGFYQNFAQYDLIAKKSSVYGYLYPFLELVIAMGYLSHFFVIGVSLLTIALMLVTFCGVFIAVVTKKEIRCACMGSKLDLPLSVVSLVETLGMGTMAFFIFIHNL